MLQSVVDSIPVRAQYPELKDARVLITGLSTQSGVDIARAFADQGARLVLQLQEENAESECLLEVLARSAAELKVYSSALDGNDDAVRFAQKAVQAYGGLEIVVNLLSVPAHAFTAEPTVQEIEDIVSARLGPACMITRIAANRMRVTWTEGLVLNVLAAGTAVCRSDLALGSFARAALAAMTRSEAQSWAGEAVRINAIGPRDQIASGGAGQCLRSEPEIAALALFLASKRGRTLSGHVFDASHVPDGRC